HSIVFVWSAPPWIHMHSLHDALPICDKVLKNKIMFVVVKITILLLSMITAFFMIGLMTTANPSSRITSTFFTNWTSNLDQSMFSDRKSTRLNSSHVSISYAVFCLKKK